jgi:hypothetical protein
MIPKSGNSWVWEPSLFFGSFFWAMAKERTFGVLKTVTK